MPSLKLTERAVGRIDAPHPSGKQTLYWDTDLRGFGVLVSGVSNAKSYIVQRRLPNGRQRRVTIEATNALSLEKAREEAQNQLHDLRKGNDPKVLRRAGATLKETLDDFLAARKNLRESSRTGYRERTERYLSDWLNRPLAEITPDMIEKRHAEIQREVVQRDGERRSTAAKRKRKKAVVTQRNDDTAIRVTGNATANSVMVILRALWNFAADRDPTLPPTNPTRRLSRQKAWFPVERRVRRLGSNELPMFFAAIGGLESEMARTYIKLLLFTGLRRNEAAGLKWADLDFPNKLIRLPARRTKAGRKLDLPMTDYVFDLLSAWRKKGTDGDYVFPSNSESGHLADPKFFLRKIATATDGIYVSAHDLRRTFLDAAESTEMSAYALKALVNHSAGGDVTAGYLALGAERLRDPAQRVTDQMKKLCGIVAVAEKAAEPSRRRRSDTKRRR